MIYLLAFFASYIFIALKSFQQLNVMHYKLSWITPTSMAMAICEVLIIVKAAEYGWGWIVLPIGLGSGLGSVSATVIHRKLTK